MVRTLGRAPFGVVEPLEPRRLMAAGPVSLSQGALASANVFFPGRLGNALALDSIPDMAVYASMGDPIDGHLDSTPDFTIEYWVRFSEPLQYSQAVVSKDESPTGVNRWMFGYGPGSVGSGFRFEASRPIGNTGQETEMIVGPYTVNTGEWYHLAYVKAGNTQTIYVNGAVLSAGAISGLTLPKGFGPLVIGQAGGSHFTRGAVDDVRVWSVARTGLQILTSKDVELTGSETGLVGYWKMNETGGATVADSSPYQTTGNLFAMAFAQLPRYGAPTAGLALAAGQEGAALTATMSGASDPTPEDVAAGFRYSFDLGDDGTWEVINAVSPEWSTVARDSGEVKVRARISDQRGTESSYVQGVQVGNVAPAGTFSSGGSVSEGSAGGVSFSGVVDPSVVDAAAGFKYSYDFDNDGVFEVVATGNATATVPGGYLADGPGVRTVRGRLADKDGGFTDYTTTITIVNAAPTVSVVGTGVVGAAYVLSLQAADAGADAVQGWVVNWGDGSGTSQVSGAGGVLSHDYAAAGEYSVVLMITDEDGTHQVTRTLKITRDPAVVAMTGAALAANRSSYGVTVTYTDDLGVDVSTLGDDDLVVTRGGVARGVRFVSAERSGDGKVVVARYDVAGQGGAGWSWRDSGVYEVAVRAGAVVDLHGVAATHGGVGTFALEMKQPDASDLVGKIEGVAKTFAPAGAKNTVTVKVFNRGNQVLSAIKGQLTVRLYVSRDRVWDASDVLVGTVVQRTAIPVNGSRAIQVSYATPKGVAKKPGTYYLVAVIDPAGMIAERDEENNSAVSGAVKVLKAGGKPAKPLVRRERSSVRWA